MEIESQMILAATLYKVACLVVGGIFGYMGYRLFAKGIWGNAGDLESEFKSLKIVMRKAAPGSFFSLFGAIIICSAIFTQLTFSFGGTTNRTNPEKQTEVTGSDEEEFYAEAAAPAAPAIEIEFNEPSYPSIKTVHTRPPVPQEKVDKEEELDGFKAEASPSK